MRFTYTSRLSETQYTRRAAQAVRLVCAVFLCAALPAFAQTPHNPGELSAHLYERFTDAGLSPQKQLLAGPSSDGFPFNIVFDTQPDFGTAEQDTLIIQICQEDALPLFDRLCALISRALQVQKRVQIICTTLDYPVLPQQEQEPRGSLHAISQLENQNNICALLLIPRSTLSDTTRRTQPLILPGAGGQASPQWLLDMLQFYGTRSYLLLYRQNMISANERLALFLNSSIPAAGIVYDAANQEQTADMFSHLEQVINTFEIPDNALWDRHYDRVPVQSVNLIIPEHNQVRLFIVIITVSLFVLCGFTFLFGKNIYQNTKDFLRTWYLIPGTIAATALMLKAGQAVSGMILPASTSPFLFIVFKIIFAVLFVTLCFIILLKLHLPVSQVVYGVMMSMPAPLNIFIFAAFDISFVYLFAIEYIIAAIAGYARRFVPLVAAEIALVLPFLPYIRDVIAYPNTAFLEKVADASFAGNLLLACILLPMLIMWLKLQIRITVFLQGRNISIKPVIAITVLTMICSAAFAWIYLSSPRFQTLTQQTSRFAAVEQENPEHYEASITASETFFLELRTVQLSFTASAPIIRCDIHVISDSGTPVYSSDYPIAVDKQRVSFLLPEYPPEPLQITYTANETEDMYVSAVFYLQKDDTTAAMVEKQLFIPGKSQP